MGSLVCKRSLLFIALAALAACDTRSPTGPSSVTPTTSISTTTTTSVPPTGPVTSTSTSTATTSIPSLSRSRTYVSLGPVAPTVPSQLTVVVQPVTRPASASSFLDRLPFLQTQIEPIVSTVTGFYITPGGGTGRVIGELLGTLDDGIFNGTLTSDSPECVAEREFGGGVDPQFLRWNGGRTLRDCKG